MTSTTRSPMRPGHNSTPGAGSTRSTSVSGATQPRRIWVRDTLPVANGLTIHARVGSSRSPRIRPTAVKAANPSRLCRYEHSRHGQGHKTLIRRVRTRRSRLSARPARRGDARLVTKREPSRGPTQPWPSSRLPLRERSPSGLWRRTGNAVRGNASRVRIPPSPPPPRLWAARNPGAVSFRGRARRGTSGALYLQSAPAGLNSLPRPARADADGQIGVEDRVPRSGESRTVSGPEGSSTQRSSSGAAERPGPSRLQGWARVAVGRRGVHGIPTLNRAQRGSPGAA